MRVTRDRKVNVLFDCYSGMARGKKRVAGMLFSDGCLATVASHKVISIGAKSLSHNRVLQRCVSNGVPYLSLSIYLIL